MFNLLLQKNSFIIPSDKGNIKLLMAICTYRVKNRKHAIMGKFLKFVLKKVSPKFHKIRKKKTKGVMIRSNIYIYKKDKLGVMFFKNSVIPLKRRMNPWNKRILGPTLKEFRLKKFRIGLSKLINNAYKIFTSWNKL